MGRDTLMQSAIYDVLFDRVFSHEELTRAVAALFEVELYQIYIETNQGAEAKNLEGILVLCTLQMLNAESEFPILLDVAKSHGFYHFDAQEKTVELLCELLNCRALIVSEEIDPNVYIEISGVGKRCEVYLDPTKRKQDIYIIQEYL